MGGPSCRCTNPADVPVRCRTRWCAALSCVVSIAGHLDSQAPLAARDSRVARYDVRVVTVPIRLDARAPEAVWGTVDSIVDFRQREPREGAPATERTVVRIVRSDDRLYVMVRAYQHDMATVRSAQLRRDADLSTDDNVTILIDSYRDRRGAFLFQANPTGAMWDAQLTGLDNVNENWNGL